MDARNDCGVDFDERGGQKLLTIKINDRLKF